jgi:tetratricopeptide (TPR) repeat protein
VAWKDARAEPLHGEGAGAFVYSYTRDRGISLSARDAHSVEMELLSELGFPALVMFAAIVVGAAAAALRSRRLGPSAATLCAGALGAGTYWLFHSSVDWFWTYPALTAPVFALLGSAAAPALSSARAARAVGVRVAAAGAALVAIVAATALYLSERYTNDAYDEWRTDLQGAYSDLDRAQTLNPFADEPLVAEGAIAKEVGDRARALDAFRDAADRTPQEWGTHYFLGQLLASSDPAAAERELEIAAELNPRSAVVHRALAEVQGRETR